MAVLGMPPMAGPGLMGMGGGPPGMGGPDPGAMGGMEALMGAPSPGGEEQALKEAAGAIGMALARAYSRSAKAAIKLSKALTLVNEARQELQQASESAVGSPPELMGAMLGGSPMGPPAGPSL